MLGCVITNGEHLEGQPMLRSRPILSLVNNLEASLGMSFKRWLLFIFKAPALWGAVEILLQTI